MRLAISHSINSDTGRILDQSENANKYSGHSGTTVFPCWCRARIISFMTVVVVRGVISSVQFRQQSIRRHWVMPKDTNDDNNASHGH